MKLTFQTVSHRLRRKMIEIMTTQLIWMDTSFFSHCVLSRFLPPLSPPRNQYISEALYFHHKRHNYQNIKNGIFKTIITREIIENNSSHYYYNHNKPILGHMSIQEDSTNILLLPYHSHICIIFHVFLLLLLLYLLLPPLSFPILVLSLLPILFLCKVF